MKNKRGILGEGVLMIYRLLLVSLLAFIILGVSSVFYIHYIDVRDAEARIIAREVVNCLAPEGIFEHLEKNNEILVSCGFDDREIKRFYVDVVVKDSFGNEVVKFSQGDSGAIWIKEIFSSNAKFESKDIGRYEPGYYKEIFPVVIDGDIGEMKVEVLVNAQI